MSLICRKVSSALGSLVFTESFAFRPLSYFLFFPFFLGEPGQGKPRNCRQAGALWQMQQALSMAAGLRISTSFTTFFAFFLELLPLPRLGLLLLTACREKTTTKTLSQSCVFIVSLLGRGSKTCWNSCFIASQSWLAVLAQNPSPQTPVICGDFIQDSQALIHFQQIHICSVGCKNL